MMASHTPAPASNGVVYFSPLGKYGMMIFLTMKAMLRYLSNFTFQKCERQVSVVHRQLFRVRSDEVLHYFKSKAFIIANDVRIGCPRIHADRAQSFFLAMRLAPVKDFTK